MIATLNVGLSSIFVACQLIEFNNQLGGARSTPMRRHPNTKHKYLRVLVSESWPGTEWQFPSEYWVGIQGIRFLLTCRETEMNILSFVADWTLVGRLVMRLSALSTIFSFSFKRSSEGNGAAFGLLVHRKVATSLKSQRTPSGYL